MVPLNPTFQGHIASTMDALVLFQACLSGQLSHVPRRPHDGERKELIKSGNVFIYEGYASGIKRWTDGVSWSPSRILGNFLVYRELKDFPPGEKKRVLRKNNKKPQHGVSKSNNSSHPQMGFPSAMDPDAGDKDLKRSLLGSLIDSYPFKDDGLVKKTISINFQGVSHHLVSYYTVDDVMSGRLTTPTRHPDLRNIIPHSELILPQNFRAPIDVVEFGPDDRVGSSFYPSQISQYRPPTHYSSPPRPQLSPLQQQQQQPQPQQQLQQQLQQQQLQQQYSFVNWGHPSLALPVQENYVLDPARTIPRNMPIPSSPAAFVANASPMTFSSMPEAGRIMDASCLLGQRVDEGSSQLLGLEGNGSNWNFEDGSQDAHNFPGGSLEGSQQY